MGWVTVIGVDRPRLAVLLATHGLSVAAAGQAAAAALIAAGAPLPPVPTIIEVPTLAAAVARLSAGADGVVLPSDPDTLVAARLAALARRRPAAALAVGDLAIDLVERSATRGGRRLPLLPREYALLVHLARAGGAPVSRAELTRAVLGLAFDPGTNVIAAHLSKLRAKLHQGFASAMLVTERGRGYRLIASA